MLIDENKIIIGSALFFKLDFFENGFLKGMKKKCNGSIVRFIYYGNAIIFNIDVVLVKMF